MWIIWLVLMLVCSLLPLRATEAALRIGVWNFSYLTPMLLKAAEEQGFFAAEGLDVEFQIIRRDVDMVAGLLSGSIDVMPTAFGSGVPLTVRNGAAIRVVQFVTAYSDLALVSRLPRVSDLSGRRIATTTPLDKASNDLILAAYLRKSGISAERMPFESFQHRLAALRAGAIDAAALPLYSAIKLRPEGFQILVTPDQFPPVPVFGLTVRAKDAENGTTKRLQAVMRRTMAWYLEDTTGATGMLTRYAELSESEAKEAVQISRKLLVPSGRLPRATLVESLQILNLDVPMDTLVSPTAIGGP